MRLQVLRKGQFCHCFLEWQCRTSQAYHKIGSGHVVRDVLAPPKEAQLRGVARPARQWATLRFVVRAMLIMDSTGLDVMTVLPRRPSIPRRLTVNISSRPSRSEQAAPGWCRCRTSRVGSGTTSRVGLRLGDHGMRCTPAGPCLSTTPSGSTSGTREQPGQRRPGDRGERSAACSTCGFAFMHYRAGVTLKPEGRRCDLVLREISGSPPPGDHAPAPEEQSCTGAGLGRSPVRTVPRVCRNGHAVSRTSSQ
jgi:hypothetical protein